MRIFSKVVVKFNDSTSVICLVCKLDAQEAISYYHFYDQSSSHVLFLSTAKFFIKMEIF